MHKDHLTVISQEIEKKKSFSQQFEYNFLEKIPKTP